MNIELLKEKKNDAINWLLNSGIQNLTGKYIGGINSWYDIEKRGFPFIYSEITGYSITFLLYLFNQTNKQIYLDRAMVAYNYLIKHAKEKKYKLFYCRFIYDEDQFLNHFCLFDNGIILNSFVNLYKVKNDKKILSAAIDLADSIIRIFKLQHAKSLVKIVNGKPVHFGNTWSKQFGTYLSKIGIGFLNLYLITGDQKYELIAKKLFNYSKERFLRNGRVITNSKDKSTYLHPMLYTLEGLYVEDCIYKKTNEIQIIKSLKWIEKLYLKDKSIPSVYNRYSKNVEEEHLDIIAQSLRLISLYKYNNKRLINYLIGKIEVNQCNQSEGLKKGGFIYNSENIHINSWVTMFCVQALDIYLGKRLGDPFLLV
ncbi:MAG: hypothetical protein ACOCUI_04785 [bacterium]